MVTTVLTVALFSALSLAFVFTCAQPSTSAKTFLLEAVYLGARHYNCRLPAQAY